MFSLLSAEFRGASFLFVFFFLVCDWKLLYFRCAYSTDTNSESVIACVSIHILLCLVIAQPLVSVAVFLANSNGRLGVSFRASQGSERAGYASTAAGSPGSAGSDSGLPVEFAKYRVYGTYIFRLLFFFRYINSRLPLQAENTLGGRIHKRHKKTCR